MESDRSRLPGLRVEQIKGEAGPMMIKIASSGSRDGWQDADKENAKSF